MLACSPSLPFPSAPQLPLRPSCAIPEPSALELWGLSLYQKGILILAKEQAVAFTRLLGTDIVGAKSLGGAAMVFWCTGSWKSWQQAMRGARIWEGSVFKGPQHGRCQDGGPA